ncbi:class I SAM-dependent methyltransferase [Cellulomonas sp. WB94]|nr:class I SAM-dependent methyltransferase [Cellulomonas sp. WB94]
MDAAAWDARYAAGGRVWTPQPNLWAVEAFGDLTPGTALDLGTGEGRHALWLAGLGWDVTAVDFSAEALRTARAVQGADAPGTTAHIEWVHADLLTYTPAAGSQDAVLLMYIHLLAPDRRALVRSAARALAPGGTLLVVGHDLTNPAEGTGGPSDATVLFTAHDVAADLAGEPGIEVRLAQRRPRTVEGAVRPALDAVVVAVRTT